MKKIKIQVLAPSCYVGAVPHPKTIDVTVHKKDGVVEVDDLQFDFHNTPLKNVCWGIDEKDKTHCYQMGLCEECGILFLIRKDDEKREDHLNWELSIFKHLFEKHQEFREKILEDAA